MLSQRTAAPCVIVLAIAMTAITGCSDLGPAARFGRYTAELYVPPPPPSYPTATADGEFVASLTTRGNRVGKIAGRLAYWPAGAAAPQYLFRADTNPGALAPVSQNDRGEIVLRAPSSNFNPVYLWKSGAIALLDSWCSTLGLINNRGIVWFNECADLYNRYFRVLSPFGGADTAQTRRFTGSDCGSGGRYSTLISFNDSNEVLVAQEVSAGTSLTATMWYAGGCRNLTSRLDAQWQALSEIGLVGGRYGPVGSLETAGVLTDGENVATIDDLLDPEARAKWHVTSVDWISTDRSMVVHAIDLVTNQQVRLRLTPGS